MKELVSQIEFLQSECSENQRIYDSLRLEFGHQRSGLFEKPLMSRIRVFKAIINSLEELKKIKGKC
ncbi:MAG: hypothetical protein CMP48_17585 [Rickettsiales bacterium]|nr:hypothetical protein [Rickettsiales bacterium]